MGITQELRGVGGGGGGNYSGTGVGAGTVWNGDEFNGSGTGGSGGSSGPWHSSSNNELYDGLASQGIPYRCCITNICFWWSRRQSLIGCFYKQPILKHLWWGGGGASSDIYNDGGNGYYHTNGKNGIEIDIGGSVRTVAAGGGGSQMGYHPSWYGSSPNYNTSLNYGLVVVMV